MNKGRSKINKSKNNRRKRTKKKEHKKKMVGGMVSRWARLGVTFKTVNDGVPLSEEQILMKLKGSVLPEEYQAWGQASMHSAMRSIQQLGRRIKNPLEHIFKAIKGDPYSKLPTIFNYTEVSFIFNFVFAFATDYDDGSGPQFLLSNESRVKSLVYCYDRVKRMEMSDMDTQIFKIMIGPMYRKFMEYRRDHYKEMYDGLNPSAAQQSQQAAEHYAPPYAPPYATPYATHPPQAQTLVQQQQYASAPALAQPAPSNPINITILVASTPLKGKKIDLTFPQNTMIRDVKAVINQQESVLVKQQQNLIFAGNNLEDGRTLESYNIGSGDTVHLVIRNS